MTTLESRLKQQAHILGFELAGIARAAPPDGFDQLLDWLARGFAGEMDYMARHAQARRDPGYILTEVQSVLMLGLNYPADPPTSEVCTTERSPTLGKVARYARGPDYHQVIRSRLKQLQNWLKTEQPACRTRGVVDTAPLLERDFARRAGLGWIGRNTMLIDKRQGSYLFLAALLTDLTLEADSPHATSHCGTCTACLEACPTQAFVEPGLLDSRRCISYLTIELRNQVPEDLRPGLGNWVFGCDICQEVCPWNRKAAARPVPSFPFQSNLVSLDLGEILSLSEEGFQARFGDTALARPGRGGLLRNAALVLGNIGSPHDLPNLHQARKDPDPLVQEAATWAIDRIERRFG
jgi:epoxyqueuosine reductase